MIIKKITRGRWAVVVLVLFTAVVFTTYDTNINKGAFKKRQNTMDNSCWFEKIPLDEFDEDKSELMTQLRATKWSSKMQFYRKVREPCSVDDLLKHVKGNHLVWMNEESFILLKKLPKTVPRGLKYRKAATNVDFGPKSIYIYGVTNDIVADITEQFLLLKGKVAERNGVVQVGTDHGRRSTDPNFRTTFLTPRFLSTYAKANPQRRLILGRGCCLSKDQSIALASHPDPLDVVIGCRFDDFGNAFTETLSRRTTFFGTLVLREQYFPGSVYTFNTDVISEISQIALITASDDLRRSHFYLPLSSPARRVEYTINGARVPDLDDTGSLTVDPQAITLVFSHFLRARFHTQFLLSSGNVRELGLIYDTRSHSLSGAQQKEILEAIERNQNLYRLELGCLNLDTIWDDLLEVMGSHGSLRTVAFWVSQPSRYSQSQPDLHRRQVESLVAFMNEHIHLDISFKYRLRCSIVNAVEAIIKPVRLQNRVRLLTRESAHDRPAVFGAALTSWAARDVSKISLLLSENTDLLCSLVGQPLSLAPPHDPEQRTETRKRSVPSSPNAKNKLSKLEF